LEFQKLRREDAGTTHSLVEFVTKVTQADSPDSVPPDERIAVFDNDGLLWSGQPVDSQAKKSPAVALPSGSDKNLGVDLRSTCCIRQPA